VTPNTHNPTCRPCRPCCSLRPLRLCARMLLPCLAVLCVTGCISTGPHAALEFTNPTGWSVLQNHGEATCIVSTTIAGWSSDNVRAGFENILADTTNNVILAELLQSLALTPEQWAKVHAAQARDRELDERDVDELMWNACGSYWWRGVKGWVVDYWPASAKRHGL